MAGPIAIVGIAAQSAKSGIKLLLILLAIISINLAILNIIPLPILDGGQALTYTIEAIIGRSIPIKVREGIHIATWIAFVILFIYLSAKDISYLFGPYLKNISSYLWK